MLKLHIKHLSSDDLHVKFTVTRSIIVPETILCQNSQQHPSFRHNDRFADTRPEDLMWASELPSLCL